MYDDDILGRLSEIVQEELTAEWGLDLSAVIAELWPRIQALPNYDGLLASTPKDLALSCAYWTAKSMVVATCDGCGVQITRGTAEHVAQMVAEQAMQASADAVLALDDGTMAIGQDIADAWYRKPATAVSALRDFVAASEVTPTTTESK